MIAEEGSRTPFKESVRGQDLLVAVPEKFRGLAGKALVVDHPYFELEAREDPDMPYALRFLDVEKIKVADLPRERGYYFLDESGIPNQPKNEFGYELTYSDRTGGGKFSGTLFYDVGINTVGPIVRYGFARSNDQRKVFTLSPLVNRMIAPAVV